MTRKILPLIALSILCVPLFGAEDDGLPPPEATEYYEPVPAVVHSPPGGVPTDAIVLFDGTSLDAWEPAKSKNKFWKIKDGAIIATPGNLTDEEAAAVAATRSAPDSPWDGIRTKQNFGDVQLHIEFRTPAEVEESGQGRGNSGVFFMDLYEIQVLDSWENPTYVNGQLGSIYKQYPPLVNPARPPGEWQVYDVVFIAPRFAKDGSVESPARMTAFLNGVLIQYDSVLLGPTVWRGEPEYHAHADKLPIVLQDHNDHVAYRNIWVRELDLP
jgi:hypothetical protein